MNGRDSSVGRNFSSAARFCRPTRRELKSRPTDGGLSARLVGSPPLGRLAPPPGRLARPANMRLEWALADEPMCVIHEGHTELHRRWNSPLRWADAISRTTSRRRGACIRGSLIRLPQTSMPRCLRRPTHFRRSRIKGRSACADPASSCKRMSTIDSKPSSSSVSVP